jgi:hypothetical protein
MIKEEFKESGFKTDSPAVSSGMATCVLKAAKKLLDIQIKDGYFK